MNRSQYELLPLEEDDAKQPSQRIYQSSARERLFTILALIVAVGCTVINITTLKQTSATLSPTSFPYSVSFLRSQGISRKQIDNLRRPSQFIGLEKLHKLHTPTEAKSFVNFPILMSQVDMSQPHKVSAIPEGVMTHIGTVYPETSDMVVSHSVSTIVQYRAIDFGMEWCELNITIPEGVHLTEGNAMRSTSTVAVYRVLAAQRLYIDELTYANRPSRGERLGVLSLHEDTSWGHRFPCSMDEIITFEVACAASECDLFWTQDKEHNTFPAMVMWQHSSTDVSSHDV